MRINIEQELTGELLTKDIQFHRETNRDTKSCDNIKALSDLLADTICRIGFVRSETMDEPNNSSGKDIRENIDDLIKQVEIQINEIKD
ncbi:hypothetical protein GKR13_13390 [Staphylococcus aureus]|uniref:hypothetical protein n=1 Tax=Staphylococcus aureus TaxID=1280 RepID=UPI001442F388|nr:hypothetical protein [Staphylococcus aureus]NKP84508.1 hypothetical protein [Staphylococcus aureus]